MRPVGLGATVFCLKNGTAKALLGPLRSPPNILMSARKQSAPPIGSSSGPIRSSKPIGKELLFGTGETDRVWTVAGVPLAPIEEVLLWPHVLPRAESSDAVADPMQPRSYGEVSQADPYMPVDKPPITGGMFCPEIFGPPEIYRCSACQGFARATVSSAVCQRCEAPVPQAVSTMSRWGHVKLLRPICHPWFHHPRWNAPAILLGLGPRVVDHIVSLESHLVIEPADSGFLAGQILSEAELKSSSGREFPARDMALVEMRLIDRLQAVQALLTKHPGLVLATGAKALRAMLQKIDLGRVILDLKARTRISRDARERLELAETFVRLGMKPENMIIESVPVVPPILRPMWFIGNEAYLGSTDIDIRYRNLIYLCRKAGKLIEMKAPAMVIMQELRYMRNHVTALYDHSLIPKPKRFKTGGNRPSLAAMLRSCWLGIDQKESPSA